MSERVPGLPCLELARRLESTCLSSRDVRAMFQEQEFQAIEDRNLLKTKRNVHFLVEFIRI
jgi:hypothetical protein